MSDWSDHHELKSESMKSMRSDLDFIHRYKIWIPSVLLSMGWLIVVVKTYSEKLTLLDLLLNLLKRLLILSRTTNEWTLYSSCGIDNRTTPSYFISLLFGKHQLVIFNLQTLAVCRVLANKIIIFLTHNIIQMKK